jgi:predicted Zn-dependent peptidase
MENKFIDPYEFSLPNGLRVVYTHYPHLSSFSLSMIGRAGSIFETFETAGVAHFLEHVVFDGTEKYPNEERVAEIMENIGGSANASTSNEYVNFYATTLSKDVEKAFDYVSQVVLHPLLEERSILKQRYIITEEVNMYSSDPQSVAADKMMDLLYPDSRLGGLITGTVEDVARISRKSIGNFMKDRYIADNFVLSVCGSVPLLEIKDLTEQYFSGMRTGEVADSVSFRTSEDFAISIENWPNLKQETLFLAYHAPHLSDERTYAFDLMNYIFGKGELSRLFSTIREKHNLTYFVGSKYSPGPDFGHLYVYAGLNEENNEKFVNIYTEEVKKIMDGFVSEAEYKRAINNFTADLLYKSDSTMNTARIYGYSRLFDKNLLTFTDIIKNYKEVTLEDIRNAAREMFAQKPKISAIGRNVEAHSFDSLK